MVGIYFNLSTVTCAYFNNSFLASDNFCCLQVTFANSFSPDQDQHTTESRDIDEDLDQKV